MKISIFLVIIMFMSCGVTTKISYIDEIYYSPQRGYNYSPYLYNPNNLNNLNYLNPYGRQYIYIVPKQNFIEPKRFLQQPRQYNFNNIQPKQNSVPVRKFPQTKN